MNDQACDTALEQSLQLLWIIENEKLGSREEVK